MRLWTLHPKYLDSKGLVALWREALLAQKVLRGGTKGYRNHPQLLRFLGQKSPLAAIGSYLAGIEHEAVCRGYRFDKMKICLKRMRGKIKATRGQLLFERSHLLSKLVVRDPKQARKIRMLVSLEPHPLFRVTIGKVSEWEKSST